MIQETIHLKYFTIVLKKGKEVFSYWANTLTLIWGANRKLYVFCSFFFFFGPVNHQKLISNLVYSGTKIYFQNWFQSYLQDQSYHVSWRVSTSSSLLSGFPRGQFWIHSCSCTLNYCMGAQISWLLPLRRQWHMSLFLFLPSSGHPPGSQKLLSLWTSLWTTLPSV